jgi:hypothetical protein
VIDALIAYSNENYSLVVIQNVKKKLRTDPVLIFPDHGDSAKN